MAEPTTGLSNEEFDWLKDRAFGLLPPALIKRRLLTFGRLPSARKSLLRGYTPPRRRGVPKVPLGSGRGSIGISILL